MSMPTDAITALRLAGKIDEPYWGRNEYDLRWIAKRDWTASRSFELQDLDAELVLDGIDTIATVRINGQEVLTTDNAFRTWRADISGAARLGENTIDITFHSATRAANLLQDQQPFFIPYSVDNSPIPNGNMLRKVQCDFGWDWNIALAPFGLYGSAQIVQKSAPKIERLEISQAHSEGLASLTVTAHFAQAIGEEFSISFAGRVLEGEIDSHIISVIFDIDNPEIWWPAGSGPQPLHELVVRAGSAVETRQIGLRKVELITEDDGAGMGFKFRVNGQDIFAKGANWIPADALAGRISQEAVRDLLQSAVDANMNMIRIWGGGRYEPTWFYNMCDELGLMVWQDFMFACNLYPSTRDFIANVEAEVRENVSRLHHHACIALWCGDNELIGALNWFPESRDNRDRYLVNYDRLNRAIEAALFETDPSANWWPSSPSPGAMNFGDAWHDDSAGDMHFWSVWHEGKDFDHYRDINPRFCSEFGFQSYPSMSVIETFADPQDWNIAAPVLESHQKNAGGNARIAETMFRYFRWPAQFEDFVWLSQIQQGLAIKTAVNHWRGLRPHCMGTLIWQLNDTCPVCSWSSLDYGGGWKMMHHMARRFYAPQSVICAPTEDGYQLKGINDAAEPVEIAVTAWAVNMASQRRALDVGQQVVGGDSAVLLNIAKDALQDDEILFFEWQVAEGAAGQDHFAPQAYKTYALPDPGLRMLQSDGVLSITADALALFVSVEADIPGRFSDNAFSVLPGETVEITFTPSDPEARAHFTLRDLHSATMS
ncbi:MAG: glycoside hydrolase family 2 protein [Rhodobacteraceae bacterium]|nr:glycoside hydrolase family 2 protein [Paracoccaceae bacterium]